MDDLDRILLDEPAIAPPPEFVGRVMAAVHRQAETPRPLPFPWRWAAIGFGVCALLLLAAVIAAWILPSPPPAPAGAPPGLIPRTADAFRDALPAAVVTELALALGGSLVAVRLSLRLAGARG